MLFFHPKTAQKSMFCKPALPYNELFPPLALDQRGKILHCTDDFFLSTPWGFAYQRCSLSSSSGIGPLHFCTCRFSCSMFLPSVFCAPIGPSFFLSCPSCNSRIAHSADNIRRKQASKQGKRKSILKFLSCCGRSGFQRLDFAPVVVRRSAVAMMVLSCKTHRLHAHHDQR